MDTIVFLSKEQLNSLDSYEAGKFSTSTRFSKMVAFLSEVGIVLFDDAKFSGMAVNTKTNTIAFQFSSELNGDAIHTFELSLFPQLNEFFIMVLAMAPALSALSGNEYAHVYLFCDVIGSRIIVGDASTYPIYVPQLLPKYIDNAEYGTEDAQTIAFRFVHLGEQRTSTSVQLTPAIVRHLIESTEASESNGYGEVYPAIIHGNYVEFSATVPYAHTISLPIANETEYEHHKEAGNTFIDTVTKSDIIDSYWMSTKTGQKTPIK